MCVCVNVLCALWLALIVTVHARVGKPRPVTRHLTACNTCVCVCVCAGGGGGAALCTQGM